MISDFKQPATLTQTRGTAPFIVDERSVNDYYPYGMLIPERSWSSTDYRYGYNTQEKSLEIDPNGNHTTAEFWEYDARTGRRWNMDPKPITGISDYATFRNNPILYKDWLGDSSFVFDKDLKYVSTIDDGRKEYSITVTDKDNKNTRYTLNDDKNDAVRMHKLIYEYGSKKQFIFTKTNQDEEKYLLNANKGISKSKLFVPILSTIEGIDDLYNNSFGAKRYDFWYSQLSDELVSKKLNINQDKSAFFLIDGTAYNDMDYGNRLWGRNAYELKVPLWIAKFGAEYHHRYVSIKGRKEKTSDDPADQKAIEDGWNAGRNNRTRKK